MSKYVFDVETNGLFPDKIWMLVMQDCTTEEVYSYSDYDSDLPSMAEGLDRLSNAKIIAGHNIISFDLPVMKKLLGWEPSEGTRVWDTFIMSQLCKYQRGHLHGLKGWGGFFEYPKGDHEDWSCYSKEMLEYCIRDVELNLKVYNRVSKEASVLIKSNPKFMQALELEHDFAKVNAEITQKGWVFDMDRAEALYEEILDKMEHIEDELNPQLGMVAVMRGNKEVDQLVKKDGTYYKRVIDWFEIDEDIKASDGNISGPYTRVEFKPVELGQMAEVKKFLLDRGWKPDDWTVKKINGTWIKQSPKLTDSSLKPLGKLGEYISDYYMLRNRLATVEGWIEEVRDEEKYNDGRLHGSMFTIGTPSFRCRHRVIVNIPGVYAPYGKELRSLLTCEKGMKVVGADSAGNQFRGLCHYINDDKFTDEVINGDVHQRNADTLGISRPQAKTFIYAYLFGAGHAKLGEAVSGKKSAKIGKQADETFKATLPGLKVLKDSLEDEFRHSQMRTGQGFIIGADGRRVMVGSEHQTLNYLLQTLEGITCKAALVYAYNKIKEQGLEAYPTLFYHDEVVFVAKESDAEAVKDICVEAFKEAPKSVGVMCMDGDGQIGDSYADVH
jgi:DNA polymerase I